MDEVTVYEVGPRDGLQNEKTMVATATKVELIRRLIDAGSPAIEVTSLVRPDLVPALSDAAEVLSSLSDLLATHRTVALVPNMKGLERALAFGVREVAVFASATESFAKANLNSSVSESLTRFDEVIVAAKSSGLRVRGYISMCFGDPWEGPVSPEAVLSVAERLFEAGVDELSLGDTIGVATPLQVKSLLARFPGSLHNVAVHFHDTYGQALANTMIALDMGVRTVDASVGGLGGCPFAKSATGNLATEDLLWNLHGQGISTGLDLDAVVSTAAWFERETGIRRQSRASTALTRSDS
jgi:hydroxymethylglutaryl-CoA lyase